VDSGERKNPPRFPGGETHQTVQLAAWLEDEERVVPLLLDVRTKAEFERSHLRNAQQIAPNAPGPLLQEVKDRPIVTYCSVGYRSAALAERLRAEGYSNVLNLEGSIFAGPMKAGRFIAAINLCAKCILTTRPGACFSGRSCARR
jgi:rhodanese-related sulfurtransferase